MKRIKSESVFAFSNPDNGLIVETQIHDSTCEGMPVVVSAKGKAMVAQKRVMSGRSAAAEKSENPERIARERAKQTNQLVRQNQAALLALVRAHPEMARKLVAERQRVRAAQA